MYHGPRGSPCGFGGATAALDDLRGGAVVGPPGCGTASPGPSADLLSLSPGARAPGRADSEVPPASAQSQCPLLHTVTVHGRLCASESDLATARAPPTGRRNPAAPARLAPPRLPPPAAPRPTPQKSRDLSGRRGEIAGGPGANGCARPAGASPPLEAVESIQLSGRGRVEPRVGEGGGGATRSGLQEDRHTGTQARARTHTHRHTQAHTGTRAYAHFASLCFCARARARAFVIARSCVCGWHRCS